MARRPLLLDPKGRPRSPQETGPVRTRNERRDGVHLEREGDRLILSLYGPIVDIEWLGFENGKNYVGRELDEHRDAKVIEVRIDSPGGSAYDGITIFNRLVQHGARIEVFIDGQAASAASVIAMAGDEIVMGMATEIMIHNPWICACGEADDFLKLASELRIMETQVAELYADVSGQPIEDVMRMMKEETVMSAERAVELGFATRIEKGRLAYTDDDEKQDLRLAVEDYRVAEYERQAASRRDKGAEATKLNNEARMRLAIFRARQARQARAGKTSAR